MTTPTTQPTQQPTTYTTTHTPHNPPKPHPRHTSRHKPCATPQPPHQHKHTSRHKPAQHLCHPKPPPKPLLTSINTNTHTTAGTKPKKYTPVCARTNTTTHTPTKQKNGAWGLGRARAHVELCGGFVPAGGICAGGGGKSAGTSVVPACAGWGWVGVAGTVSRITVRVGLCRLVCGVYVRVCVLPAQF